MSNYNIFGLIWGQKLSPKVRFKIVCSNVNLFSTNYPYDATIRYLPFRYKADGSKTEAVELKPNGQFDGL